MVRGLKDATAQEEQAIADYESMMTSKKKEVDTLQKMIEEKVSRHGTVGVELTHMAEDLDDTSKSLAADKKFQAELASSCDKKKSEFEERSKTRSDELVALP